MLKRGRKKLLFTPPFFIYNLFLSDKAACASNSLCRCDLRSQRTVVVLLTLCEGMDYRFRYREKTVEARAVLDGVYEIILPAGTRGRLIAEKVRKNK